MFENNYMELALEYARKALLVNEVPVGAVLINANNKELVAARHNESISKTNSTTSQSKDERNGWRTGIIRIKNRFE